jgi:hypothetical protein
MVSMAISPMPAVYLGISLNKPISMVKFMT